MTPGSLDRDASIAARCSPAPTLTSPLKKLASLSPSSPGLVMPAMGTPSSSTGVALIAGVFVSIKGVCEATAGLVLCGNVLVRDTGEMGMEVVVELVGGQTGGGEAMFVHVHVKKEKGEVWSNKTSAQLTLRLRRTSTRLGLRLKKQCNLRPGQRPNEAPAARKLSRWVTVQGPDGGAALTWEACASALSRRELDGRGQRDVRWMRVWCEMLS